MKKNKTLRIALALLVVAIITTCGMTGSLAKYVDDFTVPSKSVRAGLFRVTGPGPGTATFEVKIYEGDLSGTEAQAKGYAGLYTGPNNDEIIVPGSAVKVEGYTITNYSEVDVQISFVTAPAPVKTGFANQTFYYKVNIADPWTTTPPTLAQLLPGATDVLINYPDGNSAGTNSLTLKPFYILWPFAQTAGGGVGLDGINSVSTDAQDTTVGKAQATDLLGAAPSPGPYADAKTGNYLSVTAVINAVQVD